MYVSMSRGKLISSKFCLLLLAVLCTHFYTRVLSVPLASKAETAADLKQSSLKENTVDNALSEDEDDDEEYLSEKEDAENETEEVEARNDDYWDGTESEENADEDEDEEEGDDEETEDDSDSNVGDANENDDDHVNKTICLRKDLSSYRKFLINDMKIDLKHIRNINSKARDTDHYVTAYVNDELLFFCTVPRDFLVDSLSWQLNGAPLEHQNSSSLTVKLGSHSLTVGDDNELDPLNTSHADTVSMPSTLNVSCHFLLINHTDKSRLVFPSVHFDRYMFKSQVSKLEYLSHKYQRPIRTLYHTLVTVLFVIIVLSIAMAFSFKWASSSDIAKAYVGVRPHRLDRHSKHAEHEDETELDAVEKVHILRG